MNIMQKVTWKYMCKSRKRTIVTIIGVTIVTAMISAICILLLSFQDAGMQSVIASKGDHDILFHIQDDKTYQRVVQDAHLDKKMRMNILGNAALNEGDFHIHNTYRTTLTVVSGDTQYADMAAVKLLKGKLPEKNDEIVIAKELMNDEGFPYDIGDRVKLPLYDFYYDEASQQEIRIPLQTKKFTITGIVNAQSLQDSTDAFLAFTAYQKSDVAGNILYAKFKDRNDMQQQLQDIAKTYHLSEEDYTPNQMLLLYSGNGFTDISSTLISVFVVLFIIILIGGVSLIYNAFSISLSERSRQLGMLSSIGATRRQKRNSILFEAVVIGVISIPLGILASILGLWITFALMTSRIPSLSFSNVELHVVVNGWAILFTVLFSFSILLISAWLPALRASRISAVSAIRQNQDIRISRRHRHEGVISRKLFGIEGALGLKNMKRNRSRYLATLFSLIVCIVLYMSASYFSNRMEESYNMAQSNSKSDVTLLMRTDSPEDDNAHIPDSSILNELLQVNKASNSSMNYAVSLYYGDDMEFSDEAQQFIRESYHIPEDETLGAYESIFPKIELNVLSDADFKTYAKTIHLDERTMKQEGFHAVVVNTQSAKYDGQKRYKRVSWLKSEAGSSMHFRTFSDYMENTQLNSDMQDVQTVHVAAISNQLPDFDYDNTPAIYLISDMKNFNRLNEQLKAVKGKQLTPFISFEFESDDSYALEEQLNILLEKYGLIDSTQVINVSASRAQNQQRRLLIYVMLYGFVTLIVLICIANIVNTVTTGIELRKREFAMVRSIGITNAKFNKMIAFEVLIYGVKACLYGIPTALFTMLILNRYFNRSFIRNFEIPWISMICMVIVLFAVLGLAMMYAAHKIRKNNIVETIRQESI